MQEKAIKAAKRYLESKDYELLEDESSFDIVAKDGSELVFISVYCEEGKFPKTKGLSLEDFEESVLEYMKDRDYVGCGIRYDEVAIAVLGPDRALLRHHQRALES